VEEAVEKSGETIGITCAQLTLADEGAARRIADVLTESFDNSDAAVAAFERLQCAIWSRWRQTAPPPTP
jgi:hypothetical protein